MEHRKNVMICAKCLHDGIVPSVPERCPPEYVEINEYPHECYLKLDAEHKTKSAIMEASGKLIVASILKKYGV